MGWKAQQRTEGHPVFGGIFVGSLGWYILSPITDHARCITPGSPDPKPATSNAGPWHDFVQFCDALVHSQSIKSFLAPLGNCMAMHRTYIIILKIDPFLCFSFTEIVPPHRWPKLVVQLPTFVSWRNIYHKCKHSTGKEIMHVTNWVPPWSIFKKCGYFMVFYGVSTFADQFNIIFNPASARHVGKGMSRQCPKAEPQSCSSWKTEFDKLPNPLG